jgi:hypothetical protein
LVLLCGGPGTVRHLKQNAYHESNRDGEAQHAEFQNRGRRQHGPEHRQQRQPAQHRVGQRKQTQGYEKILVPQQCADHSGHEKRKRHGHGYERQNKHGDAILLPRLERQRRHRLLKKNDANADSCHDP